MEIYGASELGNITALHQDEATAHAGSVGLPRFGYSVRVLDDGGETVTAGTVGTIYVHGPSMSNGFIGPEPTPPDTDPDGWVTPSDMGWLDDEGCLHLFRQANRFDRQWRVKRLPGRGRERTAEHRGG